MKILSCGDVVGRAGRKAILKYIPELKERLKPDFIVVNGENSAGGNGITRKICNSFIDVGVDVLTGGDHIFDQKEVMGFIGDFDKLLRPANLPSTLPGKGFNVYDAGNKKVLVIHILAQLFIKLMPDNPFECVNNILEEYKLGKNVDAIVVDFHGEATSEKMAMGHLLDGRVSMITGTHTHVPTSDTMILENGTAYQTDLGMCGDYNSVIGFDQEAAVNGFVTRFRREKPKPSHGEPTLCGIFLETDDNTGLAINVTPVRIGGRLTSIGF